MSINRCQWAQNKPAYYQAYHDNVWGKPEHDDQKLFQWLILESFHVGLSWQLVLSKKDNFMKAFNGFDYNLVANYQKKEVEDLLNDPGIIRHRGKITAAITNAQAYMKIQSLFGSFDDYIWSFTDGKQIVNHNDTINNRSDLSDKVTADLKARGFKYIGSITVYSYLQAVGIINDHELKCSFR